MKDKIPVTAIRRLSLYARMLDEFENEGKDSVSSQELGKNANIPSTQVRKDLAYFGQFGKPGKGYLVKELKLELKEILGLSHVWKIALVGAGNLGKALFSYPGFRQQGFNITAVFDSDPSKIGKNWKGIEIRHSSGLSDVIKKDGVTIGIIAVPASGAQEVADEMCKAGIKAILNFAPKRLKLVPSCSQISVDLAIELENLSYYLSKLKK